MRLPLNSVSLFLSLQQAAIKQADNQLKAAEGLPVEWHFEHKIVRDAFEYLFRNEGFSNLTLKHTPRN